MIISEYRKKYQFKNWQLCGVWKLPFCENRAISPRRTACVLLIRASIPCSAFRHSWIPLPRYLNISTCCSIAAYLQRTLPWVSGEAQYPGLFSADFFIPAWLHMQQKSDQEHAENPVQKMQAAPIRPQKNNGWSCSFQQWHTSWLSCDCLSNSYAPSLKLFGRAKSMTSQDMTSKPA